MNDWAEIERAINGDGRVTPEFLVWLRALRAYVIALEARIAALEP
jgi:hypothetical protein